jgi:hypothetical protein
MAEPFFWADDQVAFPVTWHSPVVGLGRPVGRSVGDNDLVGDLASRLDPAAGTSPGPAGAQASVQLTAQFAAALDEQRLVDRFVADPHHRMVGKLAICSGDHHCSSQSVTTATNGPCVSFGDFGRLARSPASWWAHHAA